MTDFSLHGTNQAQPSKWQTRGNSCVMGDMDKTLLSKRHVGDGVSMATVWEEYVCRLQIWEILTSSCDHRL